MTASSVTCSICGGSSLRERFKPKDAAGGDFRPSSMDYGRPPGIVMRCTACGHGFALNTADHDFQVEYEGVEDEVTLREHPGEVKTAARDLSRIERLVSRGRLLDVGCWTGSFLVAAAGRGWQPVGLEPSRWAAARARARGVSVVEGMFPDPRLDPKSFRLVAMRDVIEHLPDPGAAVRAVADALEPGGAFFLALPDAGSAFARVLGTRWWSVMPMHIQYFTRRSMKMLLERNGFVVRSMRTHPKIFSSTYYAERLAAFLPAVGRPIVGSLRGRSLGDRLVGPNFGDRMAVIATLAGQ